ncbi:hypothetical protein [Paenibacillus polymyxa]|uniref:Uncharacterized protein n=1 Tax=Paenibacillus polymyxa (strain SC2) TaxID=886882 RepID=E3EJN6_PAEPS|nr:hypothetical protein [Paenibacillus polymyxa]ADO59634.1 hypothetical protein PPSC2_26965 [Paenibacillus polymyxa SC2]WPQ59540.1 hypothetical protein SKN87_28160 [Paenibacillus polymyxa]
MKKYQAVGMMVELDGGLTKNQVVSLLGKLEDGELLIPFGTSANNSTIYGFLTVPSVDEHLDAVEKTARQLCEDFDNERTDQTYTTETGIQMFIDCELETSRDESAFRVFSSAGKFIDVETNEGTYQHVVICPKPYSPWIHLLKFSNGVVVEVKTGDILETDGNLSL